MSSTPTQEDSPYKVREATIADASTIADFNIRMAYETEKRQLIPERVKRGVETVFQVPGKGQYFVATLNDQVVGSCMITYEWSDWNCCDYWYLQSVFVEPDHRRKGVFGKLFKYVEQACINAKSASLRLYVDKTNENAKQSYLKLGMQISHYEMFEKDF